MTALSLPIAVPPGTILTQQGRIGNQVIIVLSGAGVETAGEAAGGPVGPGAVLGSVAVLANQTHPSTVTVTELMDVLAFCVADFRRLVIESPSFVRALANDVARELSGRDCPQTELIAAKRSPSKPLRRWHTASVIRRAKVSMPA